MESEAEKLEVFTVVFMAAMLVGGTDHVMNAHQRDVAKAARDYAEAVIDVLKQL